MEFVVIDFETDGIEDRPNYPPAPRGVAISYPDGEVKYLAWGHPTGNNCSEEQAKREVLDAVHRWTSVYHNAKFDLEVMQKWAGYMPPPERWQDTMLLAFLDNPHSDTLSLKPLSEKLLSMPPSEQEDVRDWLVANGIERKGFKGWGRSICKAPGDLVGRYAVGDVVRTRKLYDLLRPRVINAGMGVAYDRERLLIPIMIENEQRGIACDVDNLAAHLKDCEVDLERADEWVRQYLGVSGLNLDENDSLADALEAAGKVTKWEYTEKGARSTAKPALDRMLTDRVLYAALMYRGSMATCVRTFMRPWLDLAQRNGGRLYTTWNTTRQEEGGGTRTGRLSSSKPLNLQNIPNDFTEKFGKVFNDTGILDKMDVGELPTLRNYIIADHPDHVLLGRDFSSQEPRTFAHVEGEWLCAKYNVTPKMDVYKELMAVTKERTGIDMTRKQAKTCIAEGQLVLTDAGLIPIQHVTTHHRVWDGVDFVSHTGVIYQGIKEVITHDGLTATPDHEVWSNASGRKIPFGEAASRLENLVRTGHAGEAVRLMDPNLIGDSAERSEALLDGAVLLRARAVDAFGESDTGALHALSMVQQQEGRPFSSAWQSVRRYCVALPKHIESSLQALWCAWNRVPVQVAGGVCFVGSEEFTPRRLQNGRDRQDRQRRSLRAGKFAPSLAAHPAVQYAQQCANRLLRDECMRQSHVALVEDGLPRHEVRCGQDDEAAARRAVVAGDRGVAGAGRRWAKVYDITNAGPRHRFTVSNVLVSNCFLGLLYGMGKDKLATQLNTTPDEAQKIKSALLSAVPSIGAIANDIKDELEAGGTIRTWGGRVYTAEPSKLVNNQWRTYAYKGLNIYCQGSAADETKEALVRYARSAKDSRLVLQIHDEVVICCHRDVAEREMANLRRCMEGLELNVPMLSEGEIGYRWGQMKEYAE